MLLPADALVLSMRVALLGGTGFIGNALQTELLAAGHEIALLTRADTAARLPPRSQVTVVPYDNLADGALAVSLEGAAAVVNMAGATIGTRWNAARKEHIRRSRVDLTRALVKAMGSLDTPPTVLVNASGAGYYGDRGDEVLTEDEPAGADWLAGLAADWESAAFQAEELGVRVVTMRTGIVFGRGGGSLGLMALPFRMFVGGPLGSGKQWMPWIHLDDIAGAYRLAIESDRLTGPVNACAGAEREREVAAAIGAAMNRPSWFPAPILGVRLLYGEFADALSASQRVSTARLEATGYQFRWPEMNTAIAAALARAG